MRRLAACIVPILLGSCSTGFSAADERAIRAEVTRQEARWDQGDLEGFMHGYSDTVCFVTPKGRTCGRDAVAGNYRKAYPDAAAMGDLRFGIHEVLPAGPDRAWMTGTWSLSRQDTLRQGGFALLWAREPAGWRIVRDLSY